MSSDNISDSLLNLLILLILLILLDLVDLTNLPLKLLPSRVMKLRQVSLLVMVFCPMKLLLIAKLLLSCSSYSLSDSGSLSGRWRLDPKLKLDFLQTPFLNPSCSWLTAVDFYLNQMNFKSQSYQLILVLLEQIWIFSSDSWFISYQTLSSSCFCSLDQMKTDLRL